MTLNLKETNMLRFNPNTLQDVRKEFGLDQQGMERAVDILQEWVQKQEHFVKKNFCREYLERIIISTKGSVEKAKVRVDKTCTLRALVPELFAITNVKEELVTLLNDNVSKIIHIPMLTEDNRLFISQIKGDVTPSMIFESYQYTIVGSEYMRRNDYSSGAYAIIDLINASMMNLVSNINVHDLQNVAAACIEGFGFRVKGIYLLSTSKVVDTLVSLLKQVLSAKLFGRIHVLKSVDELVQHFPKKFLPEDYGGDQKSISDLFDMLTEELSSEDHVKYMEEMRGACTNESLRRSGKLNDEYLGMPGTFKTLSVD